MKKSLLFTLLIITGTGCFAQLSEKEAIKHKVKSMAEWETNLKTKKSKPVQESFTRYDIKGQLIEIVERDNDGIVTLHETYQYGSGGEKIEEVQFEPNGSIKKKHVYKYVNGLRSERMTYDKRGKLIAQKKYIYEFHDK